MLKNVVYYIKDFIDRCIYFYVNDEKYRKSSKKILLYFVIISLISLSINFFDKEWLESFGIGETPYIMISLYIFIIWLVVQIMYSFMTIPSDYIEQDMDKLPDKIGKYPVVIQYDPPKGLNPSEVGMLYNQSCESTNLDCLLYKREYEGLIEIEDKGNGSVILYRNKEIDNIVPSYERQYWTMIFGFNCKDRVIWKLQQAKLNMREVSNLHSELLLYCKEKGWLFEEYGIQWILLIFLILFEFLNPLLIICLFISWGKVLLRSLIYSRKVIKTTDKGDELLAQIIGYKYWLEHCEEKQLKKLLKQDPSFNSKTLPYVIALRMDWKFLDKKFNK